MSNVPELSFSKVYTYGGTAFACLWQHMKSQRKCGVCCSAKNEVEYSELYFKAPGAAAGQVWNPCVTATGCLMLLGMALALPFAFKWPKQAGWLRETPLGKVCIPLIQPTLFSQP